MGLEDFENEFYGRMNNYVGCGKEKASDISLFMEKESDKLKQDIWALWKEHGEEGMTSGLSRTLAGELAEVYLGNLVCALSLP